MGPQWGSAGAEVELSKAGLKQTESLAQPSSARLKKKKSPAQLGSSKQREFSETHTNSKDNKNNQKLRTIKKNWKLSEAQLGKKIK